MSAGSGARVDDPSHRKLRAACRFAARVLGRIGLAAGFLQSGAAAAADRGEPSSAPNIIVIMADDLGYGDIGCYGGKAKTPQLDRLAREGMRFTDFHTNGAVCSPTRAAFLTGRYQQRSGIVTALGEDAAGLPQTERTVAAYLRERSYATGLFGKWHLGYHPENGPLHHGFDRFRGHLHGALDYVSKVDQYGRIDWWHNHQPVPDDQTYATDLTTGDAIAFIEANQTRPFFAFVSYSAIHFPWQTPEEAAHRQPGVRYPDVSGETSKLGRHTGDLSATVIAMIESLDAGVGKIVDTLKGLEIEQRTLVFFTSDNGGILSYRGGHTNISSNGPLRGAKASLYEGGHRVPALAWWPGRIPGGSVTDAPTLTIDLMPTFLELAGMVAPPPGGSRGLDGVSLVSLLDGGDTPAPRDLFWRLTDTGTRAVRSGAWKLVVPPDGPVELYNLSSDLGETRNVAPAEPQRVRALQAALARWEQSLIPAPSRS